MQRFGSRLGLAVGIAAVIFFAISGSYILLRRPRHAPAPATGAAPAGSADGATDVESDPAAPGSPGAGHAPSGAVDPRHPSRPPAFAATRLPLPRGDAAIVLGLSRSNGSPQSGARVELLRGRRAQSSTAAADGVVRFEGIEAGTYSFTVDADGLPPLVSATQVTVARRQVKQVPVTLGDYDLAIVGRVLDQSGTAVEGVTIRARRLLDAPREGDVLRADQESLVATSGRRGEFAINGLDAHEHILRTEPSGEFPAVDKQARGGSRVDIILDAGQILRVHGKVSNRQGEPLSGATVFSLSDRAESVRSGAAGEYEIPLRVLSGHHLIVLGFTSEGYREGRVNLRLEDVGSSDRWQLDLVLDELGARGLVRGVVQDPDQAPVPGQTVHLQSSSITARHEAVSGADGRFAIADVQVAADYRLWIYPQGGFQDYAQSPIDVVEAGIDLVVTLERLAVGTLRGVMVDQNNTPVQRMTLWVKSSRALGASVALTGDERGEFEGRDVPAGDLVFETRSEPRLTVRGVRFDPAAAAEVRLVIDWGPHAVDGVVVDESGQAVSGANVVMVWAQNLNGQESSSYRGAVSDASGAFQFSELGPGERKVTVNSPQHIPAQAVCNPASGQSLRLQLSPRPERPERFKRRSED